jgi:RNA polymerase sigma factor (TIGR02999 family)
MREWAENDTMGAPAQSVTELLAQWSDGDRAALDKLMPVVYGELKRLAGHYMRRESGGHTLQSSALVNEAYLRLVGQPATECQNRSHFFAIAANLMRQILVDHARSRASLKRGGAAVRVDLEAAPGVMDIRSEELISLDDALSRLTAMDERKGRVVELRYFGGLNVDESAEVLGVSPNTVIRDWNFAKAWLRREMAGEQA